MRLASCEDAKAGCRRASRSTTGPDQCFAPLGEVGDLAAPIGHARPGIRARRLIRNTPAAAITLSWIQLQLDRKSGVEGKSVSVRVDLGGRRHIKKKQNK